MRQRGRQPSGANTFADQHEILAAAKDWFSGGFETADPKAGKALLTNLADVGSWLIREVPTTSALRPVYPQQETFGIDDRVRADLV